MFNTRKIALRCFYTVLFLLAVPAFADDNSFTYRGKPIQVPCLIQLNAGVGNYDRQAIQADLEGCTNVSEPLSKNVVDPNSFPDEPGVIMYLDSANSRWAYKPLVDLGGGIYVVKFWELLDGSMGASVDYMLLKIEERKMIQFDNIELADSKVRIFSMDVLTYLGSLGGNGVDESIILSPSTLATITKTVSSLEKH